MNGEVGDKSTGGGGVNRKDPQLFLNYMYSSNKEIEQCMKCIVKLVSSLALEKVNRVK